MTRPDEAVAGRASEQSDIGKRMNRINSKRVASVAEKGGAQLSNPLFNSLLMPPPRG